VPQRLGYRIAMPLSMVIGALLLAIGIGFSVVLGAPILGIPILAVAFAVIGTLYVRKQNREAGDMRRLREQASAEKVQFTARDRESQAREKPLS
jgi:type III secretory pathway component EscV